MRGRSRRAGRALGRADLLRLTGWGALALTASVLIVTVLLDSNIDPGCASAAIRSQVQTELAREPDASIFEVAEDMHRSVAVTLDALPEDRRTGVPGSQMETVWASLQRWPHPVLFLAAGGQSFRLHTTLSAVHPDSSGMTRQLGRPHDALQGSLRLDEIGSIYAWVAGSGQQLSPAIVFLDRQGVVAFVVAPDNVFEHPVRVLPPEFSTTVSLMKSLEPVCPRRESRA